MVRPFVERYRRQGTGATDRNGHFRRAALHSHGPGLHFARRGDRIHFEPEAAGAIEGESLEGAGGIATQSTGVNPLRASEHIIRSQTLRYDLSFWLSHRKADLRERVRHHDSLASVCSRSRRWKKSGRADGQRRWQEG